MWESLPPPVEAGFACICSYSKILRGKQASFVVIALSKDVVWDFIYSYCQACHPIMRLVRLAGSKIRNIYLLKYYVMQSDWMLQKYLPKVDLSYAKIPHHIRAIMGNTMTYAVKSQHQKSLLYIYLDTIYQLHTSEKWSFLFTYRIIIHLLCRI